MKPTARNGGFRPPYGPPLRFLVFLMVALAGFAAAAEGGPRFVNRAPDLGIAHVYDGEWEHFVGGGLAVFDCDGDGLAELYAAGGANIATLLRNRSARGAVLSFAAETPPSLALAGVVGAYPLDIDGDGRDDLAILRVS